MGALFYHEAQTCQRANINFSDPAPPPLTDGESKGTSVREEHACVVVVGVVAGGVWCPKVVEGEDLEQMFSTMALCDFVLSFFFM